MRFKSVVSGSMRGRDGGSSEATTVYSGGECGGEGWMLTGSVTPLSWWFSGGLVSASANSKMFELISVEEKHRWLCDCVKLSLRVYMEMTRFPLTQINSNLTLTIFGGNDPIFLLNNIC